MPARVPAPDLTPSPSLQQPQDSTTSQILLQQQHPAQAPCVLGEQSAHVAGPTGITHHVTTPGKSGSALSPCSLVTSAGCSVSPGTKQQGRDSQRCLQPLQKQQPPVVAGGATAAPEKPIAGQVSLHTATRQCGARKFFGLHGRCNQCSIVASSSCMDSSSSVACYIKPEPSNPTNPVIGSKAVGSTTPTEVVQIQTSGAKLAVLAILWCLDLFICLGL